MEIARHKDGVGRLGQLDQGAVEIEEEGGAVREQGERRRLIGFSHGAAVRGTAENLKGLLRQRSSTERSRKIRIVVSGPA
jgi:hypothetical protein